MAERRRVLVVSDEMEVGGSQRQIAHLLCGLDRTRWQAELVYFRQRSFLVDEIEAAGVPTHCIAKARAFDPGFLRRLRAHLRAGRYDLVQCYSLTAELWLRALLPWLPATCLVGSIRGLFFVYAPWQWRVKRWVLGRCALAIANSAAGARETARRTRYPAGRIAVVPNGVAVPAELDAVERMRLRDSFGVATGQALLLFVGRLVPEKNLPLLLGALADIDPARRPLLLLAGDGPLEAEVRSAIERHALAAHVRVLGERRDASRLMQAADLLVLPSLEEGLSNVVLEAMAAGCAVLASDVGGNPEVICDGNNGLLFRSDDRAALGAALVRLCDDAALRQRFAEAALRDVHARYAIPAMIAATEAAWLRALDDRMPTTEPRTA